MTMSCLQDRLVARLITMLAYRRPYGSRTEQAFGDRWIAPLGALQDTAGNWTLRIGNAPILWSSHTDTVHYAQGSGRVHFDPDLMIATSKQHEPLGADDTAGAFLMIEMARRQVPGIYVWHSGEECGCRGSRAIMDVDPAWVRDVRAVIALDRHGTGDIITHQMGRRTASDAFALALGIQLEGLGLDYMPSTWGSYTDSETYADVVPECTNLSVGYEGEHSGHEYLMVDHVLRLLDALCDLDTSILPIARHPSPDLGGWGSWGDGVNARTIPAMVHDRDDDCCAGCGCHLLTHERALGLCTDCASDDSMLAESFDTHGDTLCECDTFDHVHFATIHCPRSTTSRLSRESVYLDPEWEAVQRALGHSID